MKKDILKKIGKNAPLKNELLRAHIMIMMLAICVALLTIINATGYSEFNNLLTASLILLSSVIALLSLFVVVRLTTK